MRISDWSSDVCSSDLVTLLGRVEMAGILTSLRNTIIAGFVLAIALLLLYVGTQGYDGYAFGTFFFRWLHVLSAVMWVGLLYYFNFVQIPSMPKIPDVQKPAIGKVIAPAALLWFRWATMATIATGLDRKSTRLNSSH